MPDTTKALALAQLLVSTLSDGAPTSSGPWHHSPGTPWTEGEAPAVDNPQRAKELAAQFRDIAGTVFVVPPDCEKALTECDTIALDTTTSQQADDILEGAGRTDKDSAIYQRMTGKTQGGGGLGGRLRLMYPEKRLADLLHAPGPQPVWPK